MIELMLVKWLILAKQIHQKSKIFLTIGIFLNKGFKFQAPYLDTFHAVNHMYAMAAVIYWWCLWDLAVLLFETLMVLIIAILSLGLVKQEAVNVLQKADLNKKRGTLCNIKKLLSNKKMDK